MYIKCLSFSIPYQLNTLPFQQHRNIHLACITSLVQLQDDISCQSKYCLFTNIWHAISHSCLCAIYSTSICVVVTLNMRSVLYFYHTMVLPLHSKRDIVKCVCVSLNGTNEVQKPFSIPLKIELIYYKGKLNFRHLHRASKFIQVLVYDDQYASIQVLFIISIPNVLA